MYAHVVDGVVDAVGNPPRLTLQNGRWYDLRPRDIATLATVGWYPVEEAAKPADTSTTTWEPVFTFDVDVVVQSWLEIPKTAEQIAADIADANRSALTTDATGDIELLITSVASLNTVIAKPNNQITGGDTKQVAQEGRRIARAVLRMLRLQLEILNSTDIGV